MAAPSTSVRAEDILRRIGDTNERALAYVLDPDPQLSRLSRKVRENVIADLPPVTNRTRRTRLIALAAVIVNHSGRIRLRLPARWPWAHQFHTALTTIRALPAPSG